MENSRNNSHILNCMPFFFFFFLIWTTFKVFIDFVTILFLFYDFSIFATGMWDLSSLTRDQTHTPCIGRQSLTGHLCVAFGKCAESVSCSVVSNSAIPWTVAHQGPLSMGFSRQEYWSGLLFPSLGDLPDQGIELRSPAFQADSLPSELPGKPF